MNDSSAFLSAMRTLAMALDIHAGEQAPCSAEAMISHALCCSLRSAADELEHAVATQSAEGNERASAN